MSDVAEGMLFATHAGEVLPTGATPRRSLACNGRVLEHG